MTSFVDLFAGAGGLSLGLMRAGFRCVLAVDNWPDAVDTYRKNLPDHEVLLEDLSHSDIDSKIGRRLSDSPDWVVGGPPCKGFSTVGKRHRQDPQNRLVRDFIRVVKYLRPRRLLMENVLGLRDMQFVGWVVKSFAEVGYQVSPFILTAADYGIPQLRRRVFFVGDIDGFWYLKPMRTHLKREYVTVWDAIGDLPELLPGESSVSYDRPPKTDYQKKLREGSGRLQGHVASKHPASLVRAISFIPDGGNRRSIPNEYQPRSGYHNSYSRLHSRSPAVAVTQNMGKPSGTRCIHPFQNRGLTAREGARLQSFPDTYHFASGISSQREQIANAVPPLLAEAVGQSLLDDDSWTADIRLSVARNGLNHDGQFPSNGKQLGLGLCTVA